MSEHDHSPEPIVCVICDARIQSPRIIVPCGHSKLCEECFGSLGEGGLEVRCPECMEVVDVKGTNAVHTANTSQIEQLQRLAGHIPCESVELLALYDLPKADGPGNGYGGSGFSTQSDSDSSSRVANNTAAAPKATTKKLKTGSRPRENKTNLLRRVLLGGGGMESAQVELLHKLQDPYGEGLGGEELPGEERGWVIPSEKIAEERRAEEIFGGGKARFYAVRDEEFERASVGAAFYLRLTKVLGGLMALGFVMAIPLLILSTQGRRLPVRIPDALGFVALSLGNVGSEDMDVLPAKRASFEMAAVNVTVSMRLNPAAINDTTLVDSFVEWQSQSTFAGFGQLAITGSHAAVMLPLLDAIYCAIILAVVIALRIYMQTQWRRVERRRVSSADFAVAVTGLPPDAAPEELRNHFSRLFALDGSGVSERGQLPAIVKFNRVATLSALSTSQVRPLEQPLFPAFMKTVSEEAGTGPFITDTKEALTLPHRLDSLRVGIVTDSSHAGDRASMGSWVADVHVVGPEGAFVEGLIHATPLVRELRRQRAAAKCFSERNPKRAMLARENAQRLQVSLLTLKSKLVKRVNRNSNPCAGTAFVTFNNEESLQRCLLAYRHSNGILRLCQSRILRLKTGNTDFRRHRIRVRQAPDPANILHENAAIQESERTVRSIGTCLLTSLLLLIGLIGMSYAQANLEELLSKVPQISFCNTEIPALYVGNYSSLFAAQEYTRNGYGKVLYKDKQWLASTPEYMDWKLRAFTFDRPSLPIARQLMDHACGDERAAITFPYDFSDIPDAWEKGLPIVAAQANKSRRIDFHDALSPYYVGTAIAYGQVASACTQGQDLNGNTLHRSCPDPRRANTTGYCPCVDTVGSDLCPTLSCFPGPLYDPGNCDFFTVATISGCYCISVLQEAVLRSGPVAGFNDFRKGEADTCKDFIQTYAAAQASVFATSAVSAVINIIIGFVIPFLVKFERHLSQEDRLYATITKIAAAQCVNAALSILVVNAKTSKNNPLPEHEVLQILGIFSGSNDDFTTAWYATAGSTLCLSAMLTAAFTTAARLLDYARHLLMRRRLRKQPERVLTQMDMNELFVGPELPIEHRYPALIVAVVNPLLFGSGLPLLYLFSSIFLFLNYAVDKWLLLRYYEKPTKFPARAAIRVLNLVIILIGMHCAIAIWMFSTPDLLPIIPFSNPDITVNDLNPGGESKLAVLISRAQGKQTLPLLFMTCVVIAFVSFQTVWSILRQAAAWIYKHIFCSCSCIARGGNKAARTINRLATKKFISGNRSPPVRPETALNQPANDCNGVTTVDESTLRIPSLREVLPAASYKALELLQPLQKGLIAEASMLRWLFANNLSNVHGRTTGLGKGLSPFTAPFSRIYATGSEPILTRTQIAEGWRLEPLHLDTQTAADASTIVLSSQMQMLRSNAKRARESHHLLVRKIKTVDDGFVRSAMTWEVAALRGSHSYDFRMHSAYSIAIMAALESYGRPTRTMTVATLEDALEEDDDDDLRLMAKAREMNFGVGPSRKHLVVEEPDDEDVEQS